jgi:hypothetical protein
MKIYMRQHWGIFSGVAAVHSVNTWFTKIQREGLRWGQDYVCPLLALSTDPPIIANRPHDLIYEDDAVYEFPCDIEGDPGLPLDVTWLWNGSVINASSDPHIFVHSSNMLRIDTQVCSLYLYMSLHFLMSANVMENLHIICTEKQCDTRLKAPYLHRTNWSLS